MKRAFTATAPNQLWVADLTYIRTHAGWTYAAFVLDVFSRRVVGWQCPRRCAPISPSTRSRWASGSAAERVRTSPG
ncbi:DDE-type integrase/transposase/recombinase [Micrococcus luteus]|uniref:DDE-type integrase/transposase/recombinase n=1 Tax=Micrococcus luteus TaxID=1270 RepID=UPI0015F14223